MESRLLEEKVLALRLLVSFKAQQPEVRIHAVMADALYGTATFVPPSSGACPARVPPRAAGLQAALAGAARRVTRPRPGGGGAGGVAPKGL